jgi:hypothetical protein
MLTGRTTRAEIITGNRAERSMDAHIGAESSLDAHFGVVDDRILGRMLYVS